MEKRGRDGWNVNKQRAASGRVYCLADMACAASAGYCSLLTLEKVTIVTILPDLGAVGSALVFVS